MGQYVHVHVLLKFGVYAHAASPDASHDASRGLTEDQQAGGGASAAHVGVRRWARRCDKARWVGA